MNAAAKGYWAGRGDQPPPTAEEALKVLDAAAEDFRGADAEFDDYLMPNEPLGKLVAVAFGGWSKEDGRKNAETSGNHWYEQRMRPFSDRYDFC